MLSKSILTCINGTHCLQINRSLDIRLESRVTFNCGRHRAVNYSWDIQGEAVPSSVLELVHHLQDPTLVLAARSLRYGNYTVTLKVSYCHAVKVKFFAR